MSARILLASPSPIDLLPYSSHLKEHGYVVRSANTGLGCLTIVRNWRPDLVVMNPDLNWGSGIGVLGVMYEDPTCPIVPIVLMVEDAVRMRAELLVLKKTIHPPTALRLSQECRVLRQPVEPDELLQIVDELLLQPRQLIGEDHLASATLAK